MKKIISLFVICTLLTGCGEPLKVDTKRSQTVYAMDTVMTLTVYGDGYVADGALEAAEAELHRLDALLSISQKDSEIYALNRKGSGVLSQEVCGLVFRALQLADDTKGAFDPTVYPLMELWGFPAEQYHIPVQSELEHVNAAVGYGQVHCQGGSDFTLPSGGGIDLGGIAKGYAAQQVIDVLSNNAIPSAIISLGGNVGTLGQKPDGSSWTVAIENPDRSGNYLGELTLDGGCFAITSGGYQRYFEQDGTIYHHILDPHTGYPAQSDLTSVTIISQDGTAADAYSTALFVMGKDKAVEFWGTHERAFDMVLYDGQTIYTTCPGKLKTELPVETIRWG